jgi:hypothetical protein
MIRFFVQLHQNEKGSISIASVFSFIFLTMVLGLVINIGRHADRKIKLQNAADAVTFSGSGVMARSMNTLAFTNRLLCDVFAVTAYLREARDRNAEQLYPPILDAWDEMASDFQNAPLDKFEALANGIPGKTPTERNLIQVFSEQNAAISEQLLPVVEQILADDMIPEFQRALVDATPRLANLAANEIANRHGPSNRGLNNHEMKGLMWQTDGEPFEGQTSTGLSQLPVHDPIFDQTEDRQKYFDRAVRQRKNTAEIYLGILNNSMFRRVDGSICRYGENGVAKMSQFGNLWRGFTRGYLKELLEEEYPQSNLLFQIRIADFSNGDKEALTRDYMFVGTAYWKQMPERMPGLFKNPMDADSVAFAQAQMFIMRPRMMEDLWESEPEYRYKGFGTSAARDLMNQNWDVKLVPANAYRNHEIIQSNPHGFDIQTPQFGDLTIEDLRHLITH